MVKTKTSNHEITLAWLTGNSIEASLSTTQLEPGVDLVHISMTAPIATMLPPCTLSWILPIVDLHAFCRTAGDLPKSLLGEVASLPPNPMSPTPISLSHNFHRHHSSPIA